MASISNAEVVNLFKKVYGDLQNLLPQDYILAKEIPFSEKQKVGEKFVEAVVLSYESGITLGGNSMDAFEIEAAVAGAVKQAEVEPYSIVLPSVIPYGVISRTAGGGQKAFFDATRHLVRNNLLSHSKVLENIRLYGQSPNLLGHVSYASATYRGVSLTNGSGTLEVNGSDITFTNGVSASDKALLIHPGEFASGLWVGFEGLIVQQIQKTATGDEVVAELKLTGVDSVQGVLLFDQAPIAPTALPGQIGSIKLGYKGMIGQKEAVGIHKILTSNSTLFGIQQNRYALFNGIKQNVGDSKLTFNKLQEGVANAVNRGGLEGDLMVLVNPRTWSTINTTEAGSRQYDASYKESEAKNGFEAICYYHQTGKMMINAHRSVKEGEAYGLHLPDWSRSGSAEVSFKVPGMSDGKGEIFQSENQAAYIFRSYSDQYLFCHSPAKSIVWEGINDEASS